MPRICGREVRVSANICNCILLFILMITCFVGGIWYGCSNCYACFTHQKWGSCLQVHGMTLEYAVAVSTASRVYACYIIMLAVYYCTYASPAMTNAYPACLPFSIFTRIFVAFASFMYFANPPHIEADHQTCVDIPYSMTTGQEVCISINPVDQYSHTAMQELSVVIFWCSWLLAAFVHTMQSMFDTCVHVGHGHYHKVERSDCLRGALDARLCPQYCPQQLAANIPTIADHWGHDL